MFPAFERAICLAALLLVAALPAFGRATGVGSVRVGISIAPVAQAVFPQGTEFTIAVPRPACRTEHVAEDRSGGNSDERIHCAPQRSRIPPVRIPFAVKGNASAIVSVRPSAFLSIGGGVYLGKVVGRKEGNLGYQIIVRFPVPAGSADWQPHFSAPGSWNVIGSWGGFRHLPFPGQIAELPGLDGVGTTPLVADLTKWHGSARGVIYIVAGEKWRERGGEAAPGLYHGSIEVTVTAAQQR